MTSIWCVNGYTDRRRASRLSVSFVLRLRCVVVVVGTTTRAGREAVLELF